MARIRSIHPGQWKDGDFLECSPLARLLCIALRNIADDRGVFRWKPLTLKAECLPADNCDIHALLEEVVSKDQVERFLCDGKEYGIIVDFCQWQRPKKPSISYPVPEEVRLRFGFEKAETDPSSEPVPNQSPTSSENPPQREEVGGRREEIPSSLRSEDAPSAPLDDPRTLLFKQGLPYLAEMTGRPETALRGLVGKWLSQSDDDPIRVLTLISQAKRDRAAEPISWIEKRIRPRPPPSLVHPPAKTGQGQMLDAIREKRNEQRSGAPDEGRFAGTTIEASYARTGSG